MIEDVLLRDYERNVAVAGLGIGHWNMHLIDVCLDGGNSRLLQLLEVTVDRARPELGERDRAQAILGAFYRILDGVNSYRQVQSFNPKYPIEIDPVVLQNLRSLRRLQRNLNGPRYFERLKAVLAEHSVGRNIHLAFQQAAIRLDFFRYRSADGAVEIKSDGCWNLAAPELSWIECLAVDDQSSLKKILDDAIQFMEKQIPDAPLEKRLREIQKRPTRAKWLSAVKLTFDGCVNAKTAARLRAQSVGRNSGIFPDGLPTDWVDIVAGEKKSIRQFASGFLEKVRSARGRKLPGRPSNFAPEEYAIQVDSAFRELTGEKLSITRPNPKSAPTKRYRTSGFKLDVMVAALQLIDASLGPARARTLIERLPSTT